MKIVLIGAGKLAWHLGPALQNAGAEIIEVYSRNLKNAKALSSRVGALPFNEIGVLAKTADLYLLAVADQAIPIVADQLKSKLGVEENIVHTSGATPGAALNSFSRTYGVFYPLQSFSKEIAVDFTKVPICVSANDVYLEGKLLGLAQKLSPIVYRLDDAQRAQLHVAAVFANNFINHLLGISHDLLNEAGIPKDILQNIIRTTVFKLESGHAKDLQTGPAVRRDWDTLKRHQAMLADDPMILEIYQKLSEHIIKTNT
ncbi:MAG: DUF2520 domain-containing protein [Saprospiraceae bacterium]